MRKIILFISLVTFQLVHGQNQTIDPTTFDYSKADSIALNFPKKKYKSYTELVNPLTDHLHSEHEKLRAIFRWITDNISYSFSNRSSDADKVVKNKKAVCIGYSNLLKEMCNSVGIECEIITGYSKTSIQDINMKFKKPDHAWNAVKLYGKWYLVDVTWAAGHFDSKKRKIIKSYNEIYFLTPPEVFIKKHFPKNKNWQLVERPVSKAEFAKQHIYYNGFFDNDILDLQPQKGLIKISLKDTLVFQLQTDIDINKVTIMINDDQYSYPSDISRTDNFYIIKHKLEREGTYELTLFLNEESVAAYKLRVRK
jgi:transglutaminase/protease-like cytokinesis protein 3